MQQPLLASAASLMRKPKTSAQAQPPMKILYYDCFAGISGDMNLAAMIDLGVAPEYLRAELSKLGLDHEFELNVTTDSRHGIHGTRVDVVLKNREAHHAHGHENLPQGHAHAHSHEEGLGEHCHDHAAHRNLADIESIIQASTLGDAVKKTSLAVFRKVAEAEARVHGKPLHEVHFHEVGATDSIVDIVGAAICFHRLGVDTVWSSPVELGGGFVRCAHGCIPVPAPATVEILQGIPTTRGAVKHETATPTGAAILAALVDAFTDTPAMVTEKTAYGIGHRDMEIPNLLRVHLARPVTSIGSVQPARLLQCNIDDMTAEMLGVAMDLLLENGAMDVHFTPILMKKNRPATCVSLLCAASDEECFTELLFRHTTTLGVKSFPLDKTVLERSLERLETPLGTVTMKNALLDGKVIRSKPELEDCREIARRHDIPLADVYACIDRHRK
jgi:pyridinium-3,5-bisthiocarboxylic acid mononucleotide nickel chelatase